MKQYVIAAGVCLTAGIGLSLNMQHSNAGMNRMKVTLAHVETLTNDESPGIRCRGLGSVDCSASDIKVSYIVE